MGMSTRVGRSVFVTTCDCIIIEGNDPIHKEVTLYGDYHNIKRATNAVKKKLGIDQVLVKSTERKSLYYSMPVETFIQNADKVTEKENN